MATRFYVCPLVGDGLSTQTAFRPVVLGVLSPSPRWRWQDGRADQSAGGGYVLVWADVTPAQHAIINALTGVTYLPWEDGAGNPLEPSSPLSAVASAKRTQIQNALEARHVPMQGITLGDTIADVMRRVALRLRLRQYLTDDDYTELLDSVVSSISAAKRTRIRDRLESLGFDLTGVVGTMTVREALVEIMRQDNA